MASELANGAGWTPKISMKDSVVTAACAQESVIPCDGADTAGVACHGLHKLVLDCVPNLEFTRMSSNCKQATISGPLN